MCTIIHHRCPRCREILYFEQEPEAVVKNTCPECDRVSFHIDPWYLQHLLTVSGCLPTHIKHGDVVVLDDEEREVIPLYIATQGETYTSRESCLLLPSDSSLYFELEDGTPVCTMALRVDGSSDCLHLLLSLRKDSI